MKDLGFVLDFCKNREFTPEETIEILRDMNEFAMEEVREYLRPIPYIVKINGKTRKIRDLGVEPLKKLRKTLEDSLKDVPVAFSDFEIKFDEFTVKTWLRIIDRETLWRVQVNFRIW